ncbi:hypothetical protein Tco_0996437 [Tanacetum coccineum]
MSFMVELSKPYDCKVTIRLRPSTILFIQERLSKSNKRLKLFTDTIFRKYLDLDVEDNDNHLLNYVLHHQRPQLSKSIDSNIVFDISGHTLLFRRRVFLEKAKNQENKASLGKAAQGKAAQGKAAKRASAGAKVEETKSTREVALEEELDLWKIRYVELESYYKNLEASVEIARKNSPGLSFPTPNAKATSLCDDIDEADDAVDYNAKATSVHDDFGVPNAAADDNAKATSVCDDIDEADAAADDNAKATSVHDDVGVPDAAADDNAKAMSVCDDINEADATADDNAKATSVHDDVGVPDAVADDNVDDRNGFTHDDEPKAEQDRSGASDRASAGAKVKETKSTREVALEEELDLWKIRYVKLELYYKNLKASVEIARKNSPGLSFPTPNAKATSVCDDIDETDAATDDNAKVMSIHDDVGILDAAADDNAKAMSVCDDIDEADATADDNAKATSVHDDVGVPDSVADDNAKATSVCDDINEADAAADDNAKATSVHDDVGVPDAAADDNAKATSVCDDVDQADAAADDNAKVPISDVYNTPVDNENVLMKDAHEIINHTDPPIHGFQIMLWGGLEKKGDGLDEAKANQEVVSAADNGEVVKETQLPDSHEDVFQPRTSKRMKKETLLSNCLPVIGNYLKEIHITRWEDKILLRAIRQNTDKDTRDEDKYTRGNTRDGKASREGENHTRESASILHEFYNDIRKLGLE